MSGIAGICNLDGAPVDPTILRRMTDFMTFRGPDAREVWMESNVGFGHTLLKTTFDCEREEQPFTIDGRVWIVADARVDAQDDLIAKLIARGERLHRGITDVELLLRAYRIWGEDCLDHLLGDFAFAIWDGPQQRLFCARDHLGVKPFFYAHLGHSVIFSNTLDCIRQHPAISDKLNDLAIADFLLFDLNQDPATTSFADIQRIPPAHRATWSSKGIRVQRYWTLPIDEPIYFKRANDYTDRFKELLDTAVNDRLRTNRIGIFMSGGLDSSALAATACKILRRRSSHCEVHAFTTVIDSLDGGERHYSGLVANRLQIPIHFRDRSVKMVDPNWNETVMHTSEPVIDPTNLLEDRDQYRCIADHTRVLFHGEGPDNALRYEWTPYLLHLKRKRHFVRLAAAVSGQLVRNKRIPLVPTISSILKERATQNRGHLFFPDWIDPLLETRLSLRTRWKEHSFFPASSHPVRPKAYRSFHSPLWEMLFRNLDAGEINQPIETRHPFMDLRLMRYMLAVPAIPWCRSKYLMRRAMRDELPDSVINRPKSPLSSDPVWQGTRLSGLPPFLAARAICEYVKCDSVPRNAGEDIELFRANFRPFALNYWLKNLRRELPIYQRGIKE